MPWKQLEFIWCPWLPAILHSNGQNFLFRLDLNYYSAIDRNIKLSQYSELGTIDLLNDSSSFGNSFSKLVHLMNSIFYVSQMNSFGSFGDF